VTDQVLRNVAITKPSSQISTYTDEYGQHPSSLANDGNRQNDYSDRTYGCAASNPETNPWWSVDLGVPTLVVQVNLTNRGDANGKISLIIKCKVNPLLVSTVRERFSSPVFEAESPQVTLVANSTIGSPYFPLGRGYISSFR